MKNFLRATFLFIAICISQSVFAIGKTCISDTGFSISDRVQYSVFMYCADTVLLNAYIRTNTDATDLFETVEVDYNTYDLRKDETDSILKKLITFVESQKDHYIGKITAISDL